MCHSAAFCAQANYGKMDEVQVHRALIARNREEPVYRQDC